MNAQTIYQEIVDRAGEKAAAITEEAQRRSEEILSDARRQSEQLLQRSRSQEEVAARRVEDLPLRLMTELLTFSGNRPQYDDICLMVLHMRDGKELG